MTDASSSIIQEINEAFERLAQTNYYELLGVDEEASADTVRVRFRELAKRYHPDRYTGRALPDDVRDKMKRLISEISRAHTVLTNPEKRRDYDATLAMRAQGIPTDLGAIVQAESLFRTGLKFMDLGKYAAALEKLDEACKANPAEPEFAATAAYCKYWTLPRAANGRVTDRYAVKLIVDHLSNYLADHPRNDGACVQLALIAKAENNMEHAIEYFEEALSINPSNIVAARELRLQRMRERKGSGFFRRLFGKRK